MPETISSESLPSGLDTASQALLAGIVASSQEAIVSRDMQGRITSWNDAARRLFGYSAEEILGQSIHRLFEEGQGDFEANQRLAQEGQVRPPYVTQAITRSGRHFTATVSASVLRDGQGQPLGVAGVIRDQSARDGDPHLLSLGSADLRILADHASTGISVVQDGRRVYANAHLARMLGYERGELLQRGQTDLLQEGARQEMIEAYRRLQGSPAVQSSGHTLMQCKDGRALACTWTAVPLNWDGRPAIMTFLTEELVADAAAQSARAADAELLKELHAIRSAVVAHDPSQPAAGRLQALLDRLEGKLPERAEPTGPAQAPPLRVLYVDDDEALVWLTTRLLSRAGFQVTGQVSPAKALAQLRADPRAFDLVVTDFNMPGMNGLDLAREVLSLCPDLPLAIASGFVDEQLRQKAASLGVREVIYKPDTVDGLVAEVQRLARRDAAAVSGRPGAPGRPS